MINIQKQILIVLEKSRLKSVKFNTLLKKSGLGKNDSGYLRSILGELISGGKIIKSGKFYSLAGAGNVLKGEIALNASGKFSIKYDSSEGVGFLDFRTKKPGEFILGDKVDFIISKKDKKTEAIIVKVLNKDALFVTGRFEKGKTFAYVVPDSRVIKKDVYISAVNFNRAEEGDKVVCEILNAEDYSLYSAEPEGKIIEVLGEAGNIDVELKSILRKYGFTKEFPPEINKEADKFGNYDFSFDKDERLDIRNLVCFTIDPEDAKDYDDSVSVEINNEGNYILGVHIADVSHFVTPNTAIDAEALKRGTSVYLLNNVASMIPETLSNNICSLKPGVDRFTFSVFITLTNKYTLKSYEIKKSVINSKRRFTYDEVEDIIKSKKGDYSSEILLLHKITRNLLNQRMKKGSIDFDSPEVKLIFDEEGKIKDIKIKERLESMRLVEELMLLANKCVTVFVKELSKSKKMDLPFIFRVHDLPDKDKLSDLSEYIRQFGYRLHIDEKQSIVTLLENVKDKPEGYIINNLLIRSMAKAVYTPKNIGHYGLGFPDYTHFTSPIRRYPDLVVHRLLKHYLDFANFQNSTLSHYKKLLPDMCKQCSVQEQNALYAERESIKIKQVEFITRFIGKEFTAIIAGIMRFGMYVEIMDYMIEGMVRFRDIEDDYYEYDEKQHCAVGIRRGKIFRAGEKVTVKLVRTDLENRKIDFILAKTKILKK
ncbi:ribonuclease R [bacterium]|nr:MAG: ribonuclease R [bacterium]